MITCWSGSIGYEFVRFNYSYHEKRVSFSYRLCLFIDFPNIYPNINFHGLTYMFVIHIWIFQFWFSIYMFFLFPCVMYFLSMVHHDLMMSRDQLQVFVLLESGRRFFETLWKIGSCAIYTLDMYI